VAVGLQRGLPLMKLFKANQPVQSEEDRARDLRLTSIASRYRTRPEIGSETPPETIQTAEDRP
jgi:hypothetical protein